MGIGIFVLVLYAYHETAISRQNLEFFASRGLLPESAGDHVFVLNGAHSLHLSLTFAGRRNVMIVERENECYDFGAWEIGMARASKSDTSQLAHKYTHVVLMNSSVRGPFRPLYESRPWWHIFIDQLGGPYNVGLVGTSLNCWTSLHETHLQSMFLVTHAEGAVRVLLDGPNRPLRCMKSHTVAVHEGEIRTSQAYLAKNYSLRTQLVAFERTLPAPGLVTPAAARGAGDEGARLYDICLELLRDNRHAGDLYYPGEYGGIDISALETVFIKHSGRGVSERQVDTLSRWGHWPERRTVRGAEL